MNKPPSPQNFLTRFQVYNRHPSFGKGIVTLMELIQSGHSLKSASQQIGMAYSKAWMHFNKAEDDLGFKLVERKTGGVGGGGTTLTGQGEYFLAQYTRFEFESRAAVDKVFRACFPPDNRDT